VHFLHFYEDFLCAFFFDFCVFLIYFCVKYFLIFLLPPIVEVDTSDIAITSGITSMVKTIILVINNTPQKTYRIAQYTVAWYRLHSLGRNWVVVSLGRPTRAKSDCPATGDRWRGAALTLVRLE
jgi:hypothetical protein